jgi:hypothetical protein
VVGDAGKGWVRRRWLDQQEHDWDTIGYHTGGVMSGLSESAEHGGAEIQPQFIG